MKLCTICKSSKNLTEFYADKSKSDGLRPDCKSCSNKRQATLMQNPKYKYYQDEYSREWKKKYMQTDRYKKWRKEALRKQSIKAKELKQEIVNHYGGKCACCGIKEICFLTIDHINNDGYKSKNGKKNRISGYLWYKKIVKDYPKDLQILCFNCNVAKQHNGGECPHKTITKINLCD